MEALTPTATRKNLFEIIKKVNENSKPILVTPSNGEKDKSAVIVSKSDWDSIEETMGLIKYGLLHTLEDRKDAEYIELPDEIDWDKVNQPNDRLQESITSDDYVTFENPVKGLDWLNN